VAGMQCFKVAPLKQIDIRYQITRHAPTIVTQKEHSSLYNKNKRISYLKAAPQKLDIAEISVQGLNALKQHEQSGPPAEIGPANLTYISKLIANYEK
jgi:hypothetical protein